MHADDLREWLEPDGRGGFASGTVSGVRTRRYHALVLPATTPPTGRMVLVSGLDMFVDGPWGTVALSSQRYAPDVVHPDGTSRIASFTIDPWPTWTYTLPDGGSLTYELVVDRDSSATALRWTVTGTDAVLMLRARPFFAARDYHSLQHQNGAFRFDVEQCGEVSIVRPYDGVPEVTIASNGLFRRSPDWYRQFLYTAEQDRGLDAIEDLATVGEWSFELSAGRRGAMLLGPTARSADESARLGAHEAVLACFDREAVRRAARGGRLAQTADAYLVMRGSGTTVIAGYPWFTDWGRDTFIAMRGLTLTTGRLWDAKSILLQWAGAVSGGMIPNRFPDAGETVEFNAVDASLWFIVAVREFLEAASSCPALVDAGERQRLHDASLAIVRGYHAGTRYGIQADGDGLLKAGIKGQQLTWMDARVGDREITPRVGKPVEVQALWMNALGFAASLDRQWSTILRQARRAFRLRFWDPRRGYLADVVDVDHRPGVVDETLRPNQILAIGGLPDQVIGAEVARQVVDVVENALVTPMGLRTLASSDPNYVGRYDGPPSQRDAVYHQGTVWPWLLGPFVEAWLRVRKNTHTAREEARRRFVEPLLDHLDTAGLNHVSEIADGDAPFRPRGCPFQAWSVGELIRIERLTRPDETS